MSLILAHTTTQDLGPVRLTAPVSALLLLPAIAGPGAAIGCHNNAGLLPLPDPARAVAARAAWAVGWVLLACLIANLGQLAGASAEPMAISRNVLIYTAIGLVTLRLGHPHLVWLPAFAYTVTCMTFGHPQHRPGYHWWATVMESEATPPQGATAGALFTAAALAHVLRPRGAR